MSRAVLVASLVGWLAVLGEPVALAQGEGAASEQSTPPVWVRPTPGPPPSQFEEEGSWFEEQRLPVLELGVRGQTCLFVSSGGIDVGWRALPYLQVGAMYLGTSVLGFSENSVPVQWTTALAYAEVRVHPLNTMTPYARVGFGEAHGQLQRSEKREAEYSVEAHLEAGIDLHGSRAPVGSARFFAALDGVDGGMIPSLGVQLGLGFPP